MKADRERSDGDEISLFILRFLPESLFHRVDYALPNEGCDRRYKISIVKDFLPRSFKKVLAREQRLKLRLNDSSSTLR